jgi:hypothetical protein
MNTSKVTSFLLCLLLFLTFEASSQGFLHAQGKAIVNGDGDTILLRGMGLGGWMVQEGYMMQTSSFANAQHQIRQKIEDLIGPADTELFYETWLNNHMQKADIDSLKSWGFNSVRLPMHYNLFTLPIEEEPVPGQHTWLDKGFELTDSILSWCAQNEMYVILDLHAAPGGQGQDQGISDYDPSKPSLWESQANRDKTVALWKKLAERYANEPWIGGYDLLNEPNWQLPGNVLLRNLYEEITDSIRTVDTNHILFIEGNWFANDFTGLTPPWDDNMAYSPHKYWSYNDQGSMQFALTLRDAYDVPLYLGESGENSNTWFRDAIQLLEANQIGWAWWPMKKIESISGPLYIEMKPGYKALLDYWSGTGTLPTPSYAKTALLEMADQFRMENCTPARDVIDAMFRQVYSDEAIPYRTQVIPGILHPTDFDMGIAGSAYYDSDLANYHVSSGAYTAWNQGWSYRNDGVDIQPTTDNVNTNGYQVGWIAGGEWMQYSIEVAASAVYDIEVRVAGGEAGGRFHLTAGNADITGNVEVPVTGGWDTWTTLLIPNVVLDTSDKRLRFYAGAAGFNLGGMNFVQKGATTTIATDFLSAYTLDQNRVQLNLNKPLQGPIPSAPAGFEIRVNGNPVPITDAELNPENTRIITFTVDHDFKSSEVIKISYSGNQIQAQDGTLLNTFNQEHVENTIAIVHSVPGKIEAEDFFFQSGVVLENTSDAGGGQNIGYLDVGDYVDYYINVAESGFYKVYYRTAALSETGRIQLQLIDAEGNATALQTVNFPPTGGWQTWTTTSKFADLEAGQHHIRLVVQAPNFNLNWFEFDLYNATNEAPIISDLSLFPNPTSGQANLVITLTEPRDISMEVVDILGRRVATRAYRQTSSISEVLDLTAWPEGIYFVTIRVGGVIAACKKLVKSAN